MAKQKFQLLFQPLVWSVALVMLYLMDENRSDFSFCLFSLAGWEGCWGCGIGHAIHDVLHLKVADSLQHHPLGIPAAFSIVFLIIKSSLSLFKPNAHGL